MDPNLFLCNISLLASRFSLPLLLPFPKAYADFFLWLRRLRTQVLAVLLIEVPLRHTLRQRPVAATPRLHRLRRPIILFSTTPHFSSTHPSIPSPPLSFPQKFLNNSLPAAAFPFLPGCPLGLPLPGGSFFLFPLRGYRLAALSSFALAAQAPRFARCLRPARVSMIYHHGQRVPAGGSEKLRRSGEERTNRRAKRDCE